MFVICLESSHARGMGHLFRSIQLARELGRRGRELLLFCNDDVTSLRVLREHSFSPQVVDLADLDGNWEAALIARHRISLWINDRLDTDAAHAAHVRSAGVPLATFDDRGSGAAQADVHIAALAFGDAPLSGRRVLRGIDYMILNPELAQYQRLRTAPGSLLVTLGGSDTYGATPKVVAQLAERGLGATVVVGPAFAHRPALDEVLTSAFDLRVGVPSMAQEMARHELAITGGGITPFEANAAGLPCLVIANADFEIPVGRELERLGGSRFAGHHTAIDLSALDGGLSLEEMSRAGMKNVGLDGVARVADALEELHV